ncbi:MAG: hypothetical protein VCD00_20975 [Candidatus Hydrogenedentota bacterium]
MDAKDKKRVVLRVTFVLLVMAFVMPWTVVDNFVTPDNSQVSRPVWGPYLIYRDPPPEHVKEIKRVWTEVQALVVIVIGGGAFVFFSAEGGKNTDAPEP